MGDHNSRAGGIKPHLVSCLPTVVVLLFVALSGLPAVWNSHWMWVDDQMVVGAQLWPPESTFNQSWHLQGREFIAHGLYFKILSLVFPLEPFWYYIVNYATHVCVVTLAALIIWRATGSGWATALCAITAGFASSGPEVFLTLLKQELQMTLWLLVGLLMLQRLMRPDRARITGTLIALAVATFLSGTLGKENFVVFPIGLVGCLVCVAVSTRCRRLPTNLVAAVLAVLVGTGAVFMERHLLGTRGVSEGIYTGSLFVFHPTFAASLERWKIYVFQTGDVVALVSVATIACAACVVVNVFHRRDLTSAQVVAITCAVASLTQVVFNVIFLSYVQVYYLYPAAILGAVGLACLWPHVSTFGQCASAPTRQKQFCRIALTTVFVVTTTLTLPTFALRLYAQNAIPAMEWRFLTAIAATPPHSTVLLGFPPDAEMIGNAGLLLRQTFGRSDITIASAFSADYTELLSEADKRPVFLAFVYEPGENWMVGIRGIAQMSHSEILALATANGIGSVCSEMQESFGPWPVTISRVIPSLRPILTVRFGYGWELDRLSPSFTTISKCR